MISCDVYEIRGFVNSSQWDRSYVQIRNWLKNQWIVLCKLKDILSNRVFGGLQMKLVKMIINNYRQFEKTELNY